MTYLPYIGRYIMFMSVISFSQVMQLMISLFCNNHSSNKLTNKYDAQQRWDSLQAETKLAILFIYECPKENSDNCLGFERRQFVKPLKQLQ